MMNFLGFSFVFAIIAVSALIAIGIWVWALVDCLADDRSGLEKVLWVLVILIFNILGAIAYFLLRDVRVPAGSQNAPKKRPKNVLMRSADNRILAGVCGGIAEYLNIDATIIRLLWVLLIVFSFGTGVLLYLVAAFIIPDAKVPERKEARKNGSRTVQVVVIAIATALVVFIISALIISLYAIDRFGEPGTIQQAVTFETHPNTPSAERLVIDHVMSHPQYGTVDGHDLACTTTRVQSNELCPEFHDPYGIHISPECYAVTCSFSAGDDSNKTYTVNALVSKNTLQKLSFEEHIPARQDCPLDEAFCVNETEVLV